MICVSIGTILATLKANGVNRTSVDNTLNSMPSCRLINVVAAFDRAVENFFPGSLHWGRAKMNYRVTAFYHFHNRIEVAKFAGHDFFVVFRRSHLPTVGEAQGCSQWRKASTEFAAKVSGCAGD